jgi:hypothetical protein
VPREKKGVDGRIKSIKSGHDEVVVFVGEATPSSGTEFDP